MPTQYDLNKLEAVLDTIADAQKKDMAGKPSPWFDMTAEQKKQYTLRVNDHLDQIRNVEASIAKATALNATESQPMAPEKRKEMIDELKKDQKRNPGDQQWYARLAEEVKHLNKLQATFDDARQKADGKEVDSPNIHFQDLAVADNAQKVRVYMAIVSPANENSTHKDIKLENGEIKINSGQLWIGVDSPYRALGWLQKYQLENNRGSKEAMKSPGMPMIRSVEVDKQFFDEHLSRAKPQGGQPYTVANGQREPVMMYVDVNTPNQFGVKTTVSTDVDEKAVPAPGKNKVVSKDVIGTDGEPQPSRLVQDLIRHADANTFETISFKHNLAHRSTAEDGRHVDLGEFMGRLGIPPVEHGPTVHLLEHGSTMFHTLKAEGWSFSNPMEQAEKVQRLSEFFEDLDKELGSPKSLPARPVRRRADSDRASLSDSDSGYRASGSDNDGELSDHDLSSSGSERDFASARQSPAGSSPASEGSRSSSPQSFYSAHSELPDDVVPRPDAPQLFHSDYETTANSNDEPAMTHVEDLTDTHQELLKLLEINQLTPGALLEPDLTLDSAQRDAAGNNKVKSMTEQAIADELMTSRKLDLNTVTNALVAHLTRDGIEQHEKVIDDLTRKMAQLEGMSKSRQALTPEQEAFKVSLEKDTDKVLQGFKEKYQPAAAVTSILKNNLVQNDLAALKKGNDSRLSDEALLLKSLKDFAANRDEKSRRLGANLFCHCLREVSKEINNQQAEARALEALDAPDAPNEDLEMEPKVAHAQLPVFKVNNRIQHHQYGTLLNQNAQAYGMPFDPMRSSSGFRPDPTSPTTAYMQDKDLPFVGGISGTTRDIIKALPTLAPGLSAQESKDLMLLNAGFMAKNQYHSIPEALYPAARLDVGGAGAELLQAFDSAKQGNTAFYQQALGTLSNSNELWQGATERLDDNLPEGAELQQLPKAASKVFPLGKGEEMTVKAVHYDKGYVEGTVSNQSAQGPQRFAPIAAIAAKIEVGKKFQRDGQKVLSQAEVQAQKALKAEQSNSRGRR